MGPTIKAIETRYNNYKFRSRLEARWAVFFDALGVEYEYEKEGFDLSSFDLSNGGLKYYLPDFYLPKLHCWLEIKPGKVGEDLKVLASSPEWLKVVELYLLQPDDDVILLSGEPYLDKYRAFSVKMAHFHAPIPFTPLPFTWAECRRCEGLNLFNFEFGRTEIGPHTCGDNERLPIPDSPRMMAAYKAAREARFEFGETPYAR